MFSLDEEVLGMYGYRWFGFNSIVDRIINMTVDYTLVVSLF